MRTGLQELYSLGNEKTHDLWQLSYSPKVQKEKFDTLCKDLIDTTEIDKSLSNNFNDFVSEILPFIGKKFFSSRIHITFSKNS